MYQPAICFIQSLQTNAVYLFILNLIAIGNSNLIKICINVVELSLFSLKSEVDERGKFKLLFGLNCSRTQRGINNLIILMSKQFIMDMGQLYPFGELGEIITEETQVSVRKTLHFSCEEEYDMIKSMVHFLKTARHDNLVNVNRVIQEEDCMHLYYEYTPLRLERWLIDVNEEMVHILKQQLIDLTEYLTRLSINFQFNPRSIGLGKDLSIKYFLNEFCIDLENQEANFQQISQDIQKHFKDLFLLWSEKEDPQNDQKCKRFESVSTNGSISPVDELSSLHRTMASIKTKCEQQQKTAKQIRLSQQIQNSKKKSMEVLLRFQKMRQK